MDRETMENQQPPINTALGMAKARHDAKIPFAEEIWKNIQKDDENLAEKTIYYTSAERGVLEARYTLTSKILSDSGITQVLELASGMSPRGLILCTENKNMTYVEMDLPEQAEYKHRILEKVVGKNGIPANLYILGGDAASKDDFGKATKHFDKMKPIAIVFEGLVLYLNNKQRGQLMTNIKNSLAEFGDGEGVCITSDTAILPGRSQKVSALLNILCFRDESPDTKPHWYMKLEQLSNGLKTKLYTANEIMYDLRMVQLGKTDTQKLVECGINKLSVAKLTLSGSGRSK